MKKFMSLTVLLTLLITFACASAAMAFTHVRGKKPLIKVAVANPMTITQGTAYAEPEVTTASDPASGKKISVGVLNRNLDTSLPGTYYITYAATNSRGETTTVTRTVVVIPKKIATPSPSPSPSPTPTKVATPKSTSTPGPDRKFSDRWFQWEYQMGLATFDTQSEMPQDFSSIVASNVGQNFAMEAIIADKVGVKIAHDSGFVDLETKVYGSSIGNVRISNGWEFLAKVYPVKDEHWLPYVGIGVKFADVDKDLEVGGTAFDHKDTTSSIMFEAGAIFPVTNFFGISVSGQVFKLGRVTSIPYTVDVSQFETFALKGGLVLRP